MKMKLHKIVLTAAALVLFPLTSQAGLIIELQKWDGFTFNIVSSASDGDGDGLLVNSYSDADGNFLTSANSFAPDIGYLTETNINFTVNPDSLWRLIVKDDSYALGNGSTIFRTGVTTNPLVNIDVDLTTSVDGQIVFNGTLPEVVPPAGIETFAHINLSDPTEIIHDMIFGNTTGSIGHGTITVTTEDVPEPTTLGLLGIAILGLGVATRRRSKVSAS